jgi:hypothetical protein
LWLEQFLSAAIVIRGLTARCVDGLAQLQDGRQTLPYRIREGLPVIRRNLEVNIQNR